VSQSTYAFGDSDAARDRLELVGRIFDPASRAFLAAATDYPPTLAVDLGCGPGGTTALVRAATSARRTVGLDLSAAFVSAAAKRWAADGVEFLQHDVTETPFPVGPVDFLYARLLVTHLAAPAEAVAQWLTQVAPGGRMALDEVEWIRTDEPVLEEYLEVATALIAQHGGNMYAGPCLAALPLTRTAAVRLSEVVVVPVAAAHAARMFRLNLGVWGADGWVVERYGADTIDRLDAQLGALSASTRPTGITWGMRHLLLERPRLDQGRPTTLPVARLASM
jgi:SAM-dependent methyltransferase